MEKLLVSSGPLGDGDSLADESERGGGDRQGRQNDGDTATKTTGHLSGLPTQHRMRSLWSLQGIWVLECVVIAVREPSTKSEEIAPSDSPLS